METPSGHLQANRLSLDWPIRCMGSGSGHLAAYERERGRERERERGTTLESRDCPVRCAALTGSRLPNQAPAAP